jgi:hypothetical protein
MKLAISLLIVTLITASCGQKSSSDTNEPSNRASLDSRSGDVLVNSNWELLGEGGGKLGFYFGPNGQFLRSAYKTNPAVQSMAIRGTYRGADLG